MEAKDAVILKIAGYDAAPPFAFLPIIFLFSAAGAILRNMNGFAGEKDKPAQTTVCGVYFVSMKPKGKRHVSPGFFLLHFIHKPDIIKNSRRLFFVHVPGKGTRPLKSYVLQSNKRI